MDLLNLTDGGAKFRDRVSNARVFKVYMLAKAPVLGVTGAYLDKIETDRLEMVVPWGRATKNMFGGVFAGAIAAAADTTSAAMLVLHIRNQGAKLQGEIVELTVKQHHAISQDMRVVCGEGERYAEFVQAASAKTPAEETFTLQIVDSRGQASHDVRIVWRLVKK